MKGRYRPPRHSKIHQLCTPVEQLGELTWVGDTSAPPNPSVGTIYYDTGSWTAYVWTGMAWSEVSRPANVMTASKLAANVTIAAPAVTNWVNNPRKNGKSSFHATLGSIDIPPGVGSSWSDIQKYVINKATGRKEAP